MRSTLPSPRRPVRLAAFALASLLAVTVTACSADDDPAADDSAPVVSSDATPSDSSSAEATSGGGAGTVVPVGQTLTDPELGTVVEVIGWVDSFEVSTETKENFTALQDGHVILVHVKVTAGDKYYNSVGPGDFRVNAAGNDIPVTANHTVLAGDMEAAGYAPLPDSTSQGETAEGWVGFVFRPSYTAPYEFVLKRLSYRTSDGATIPEELFTCALPDE